MTLPSTHRSRLDAGASGRRLFGGEDLLDVEKHCWLPFGELARRRGSGQLNRYRSVSSPVSGCPGSTRFGLFW